METTPEPIKETTSGIEDTQKWLDEITSQYKIPAKKTEDMTVGANPTAQTPNVVVDVPPVQAPAVSPSQPVDPSAPYGRYQRGKKKGQPRSTPYISAKVAAAPPVQMQTTQQTAKISGMLIDGGLFLTLINIAVPLLIAVLNNAFEKDKKKHINPEKLKLTSDQKKELDPVCDAVMKQVQLTGNPLMILLIGLMTAYGLNFMALKLDMK